MRALQTRQRKISSLRLPARAALPIILLSALLGWAGTAFPESHTRLDTLPSGLAQEMAFPWLSADRSKAVSLVREGLDAPRIRERLAAISLAVEMDHLESAPDILNLLDDPNPRVRRRVAMSLGRMGYGPAGAEMEKRLAGKPDVPLARALICGLGLLGRPGSIPTLLGWLAHPDPLVRIDAAGSLGALGRERGLGIVLSGTHSPDRLVRLEAVFVLRFFKDRAAQVRLEEMAGSSGELWRREAEASLVALTLSRLEGDLPAKESFLLGSLDHPNPLVWKLAVETLADLGTEGAFQALKALAGSPGRSGRLALRKLWAKGVEP